MGIIDPLNETGVPLPVRLEQNFKAWFRFGEGRLKSSPPNAGIRYRPLLVSAQDAKIIASLGGESAAETTFDDVERLIAAQCPDQLGMLDNAGHVNLFYVRDLREILRAVSVTAGGDRWEIDASDIRSLRPWADGSRVFFELPS